MERRGPGKSADSTAWTTGSARQHVTNSYCRRTPAAAPARGFKDARRAARAQRPDLDALRTRRRQRRALRRLAHAFAYAFLDRVDEHARRRGATPLHFVADRLRALL